MQEFSQGICEDGAAILRNGKPMTPEEIIGALTALDFLVDLKHIKQDLEIVSDGANKVMQEFYDENKPKAWVDAETALGL